MRKAHFGFAILFSDVESDLRTRPLGLILREVERAIGYIPDHAFAGCEFRYFLLAVMECPIAIDKLLSKLIGIPFDLSCPPSTNIVDRSKDGLWSLVHRNSCSEVLIVHILLFHNGFLIFVT